MSKPLQPVLLRTHVNPQLNQHLPVYQRIVVQPVTDNRESEPSA